MQPAFMMFRETRSHALVPVRQHPCKKAPVAFAEVVFPMAEPVLGTAAEAQPHIGAVQTVLRKRTGLVHAKAPVFLHQLLQRRAEKGPQAIFGKGVTVAGIYVPVGLHTAAVAAQGVMDAQRGGQALEVPQGNVKELHMDPARILSEPRFPDGAQKVPISCGRNGKGRDGMDQAQSVNAGRSGQMLPRLLLQRAGQGLYHGEELEIVAKPAQEAVDLQRMLHIDPVHRGEGGKGDAMLPKQPDSPHRRLKGARPVRPFPVGVVKLLGAVDAHADVKRMLPEKAAPFVGKQRGVGLQGVDNPPPRAVLLLQAHGLFVERQPRQGRFASVPGKLHDRVPAVHGQVLPDEGLQHLMGHPPVPLMEQRFFPGIVAIGAPQVAGAGHRLGHHGIGPSGIRHTAAFLSGLMRPDRFAEASEGSRLSPARHPGRSPLQSAGSAGRSAPESAPRWPSGPPRGCSAPPGPA